MADWVKDNPKTIAVISALVIAVLQITLQLGYISGEIAANILTVLAALGIAQPSPLVRK